MRTAYIPVASVLPSTPCARSARASLGLAALAVSLGLAGMACDKEVAKPSGETAASAAPPPPSAPAPAAPPSPPRAPAITLDDHAFVIDGVTIDGAPAEWPTKAAAVLREKPLVAGEAVVVNVLRDTRTPKVEAAVASLDQAGAKSVVVRTPTRDQSTGELALALHPESQPDCSAVAFIEREGAVAVWSKGGGGAQRFARGMAGPDLTASSEALQKRGQGCDSPVWFVGGSESIPWGLVFDLGTRTRGGGDAGGAMKPQKTALVGHATVAGRRVKLD
jgi:hypothetical protein